jgi:hypothetical protein
MRKQHSLISISGFFQVDRPHPALPDLGFRQKELVDIGCHLCHRVTTNKPNQLLRQRGKLRAVRALAGSIGVPAARHHHARFTLGRRPLLLGAELISRGPGPA